LKKRNKLSILLGSIIAFAGLAFLAMQTSVPEIESIIRKTYISNGNLDPKQDLHTDPAPFYRMNMKMLYAECKQDSCGGTLELHMKYALHLFFRGIVFYDYSFMAIDKTGKPIYGCGTVPAYVKITKRRGKWWISDCWEKI
jgi:hypothetical protein